MDLVLSALDDLFLDNLYTEWPRDYWVRQSVSLFWISLIGVNVLYFVFSTFAYWFLFDHELKKHPKYLKNQISREIWLSFTSFPITAIVTTPWFLFEVRGYSKLYHSIDDYGLPYFIFSMFAFLMFTDFGVYWIHRFEHHPALYGWLHKPHHTWKVSTPFASFAFHPLDGYFQSLPIHIFVYLMPFNAYAYLASFVFIQFWTISIHDSAYFVSHPWINSAAHHTVHHLEFNYNYGQYFTLWSTISS
ncbi:hypothetical protein EDD86DRAFT_210740 [Gorgonomyces haynaldii]|nr:hypothetical protein EDD86DRAFT_210740 [Gorgonomyces haynaldii]